jgi:hypothetical protein
MDSIACLAKSFAEIPAILKKAETFCFEFFVDFLPEQKGNFTRVNSHYTADGLLATYKCARDGRLYDVKITPRRE